ncbi:MAG TPA: hypothetical protein VFO31_30810, partial [Vicinamibacterales bacterium]|nr:hypothetical protein [Vicinamibacterales bacterium]
MTLAAPVQPLAGLLQQMRSMIERMNDDDYAAPAPGRSSGGVGGHVRHCLDHVGALISATRSGIVEYDRRDRGTSVETCRAAAVHRAGELLAQLAVLDSSMLDEPLLVETQIDPSGAMILTRSTVCREVAFVISHTIHHNAIVAQLLAGRAVTLDARFGVAPATPLESQT